MALRISFTTVSVFGLGTLVAVSLGVTIYLSGAASVRSTQLLLAERAERLVDAVEHRLSALLRPVEREAAEIARAVGSRGRLSYTVHGTAVNLASRIEALNKDYGTRILLAGKTAERCPGFELRKVADAVIRGYGEPVPLYTLQSQK